MGTLRTALVLVSLAAFAAGSRAQEADRYIVKLRDRASGRAVVLASGATIVHDLAPQHAVAVRVPPAALPALRQSRHIEYVEVDPPRQLLTQTVPYGIPMVQADQVSDASAANRTVCVIDSGYYPGHEDLPSSVVGGYPASWSTDGCGHGTHVAGTIAALNNTLGVLGVLPSGVVRLFFVRVFGDDCAWAYASDLIDALNRCEGAGANVVNMSLGGTLASTTEQNAFAAAYGRGVLPVAAAGNAGTTQVSYPAGYPSVISVAAVDATRTVASFSQRNADVELAAPGVGVLSTVPWLDDDSITVNAVRYGGTYITGAARSAGVSGVVADGGLCASAGAWAGRVVLCQRGTNSFYDKVVKVQGGGGVAAVIYNNVAGTFSGTLGSGNTSAIPAIALSQADGQTLVATAVGRVGNVVSRFAQPGSGYEAWNGTSMATPHVTAVAALVWSVNPTWTNVQVRNALDATAEDRGTAGRDTSYGYGIVRARAALDYLLATATTTTTSTTTTSTTTTTTTTTSTTTSTTTTTSTSSTTTTTNPPTGCGFG